MKQAKIRGYKKIRKPLGISRGVSALCRSTLRMLIILFPISSFIAIAIVFLLPQTPHLRVSYSYSGSSSHPNYIQCQYLGVHGMVQKILGNDCPLVAFINGKS